MRQLYLFSESPVKSQEEPRAIEDGFPIGFISRLAEHEFWRKDIYRPPYYIHKWWARRLGSVFRSILISACIGKSQDTTDLFYKSVNFPEITVFDPFMGSGTTIGEAIKLGCRAIGRDINPVSYFLVSTAVQNYERKDVVNTYEKLKSDVGAQIASFYKTDYPSGKEADILYYFWVKTVNCPNCGESIDLFKSRIFSQNATPQKDPSARAVCPNCSKINVVVYDQEKTTCSFCGFSYNPQKGALQEDKVTCPGCQESFKIIDIVKATGNLWLIECMPNWF